jgi:cystathionine beta-lyase/cystathionine gamma-synthase
MSTQGSDLSATVKQTKSFEVLAPLASHSCTHHHIDPIVAPIFISTVFKHHKHHKHGSSVESGVPEKAPETTDTRTKDNPSEVFSKDVDKQCPKRQVDVQRTNVEGQCDVVGKSMNPTRAHLETCLAGLEASSHSMVLSSGMAAFTVLWSLLKTGDHVLVIDDVYVETKRFLTDYSIQMGITSSFVDMNDIDETVRQCTPNTRVSPENPPTQ